MSTAIEQSPRDNAESRPPCSMVGFRCVAGASCCCCGLLVCREQMSCCELPSCTEPSSCGELPRCGELASCGHVELSIAAQVSSEHPSS